MRFRRIRILILLGLLAAAAGSTWLEQWIARGWRAPLVVQLVPINGDGSAQARERIAALDATDFADIEAFLQRETARYGAVMPRAMDLRLMPESRAIPPAPPRDGNVLATVWWSLKLRLWVYRQSDQWLPQFGMVKLFVLYHAPEEGVALEHSLGLQKGLIGVVHAFADPRQDSQNNVVIAHELLHTLGATDKYGPGGHPIHPDGVADATLGAGMPQRAAEIMAGRYVNTAGRLVMPAGLAQCVIGAKTAREINLDAAFQRRFGAAR
jgi:hypothetical protein